MGFVADIELEVFKGYARGWSFTPLGGPDGKLPQLKAWQSAPRETAEQAASWAAADNVGLRTGRASGVVVVDCDTEDVPLELPPTVTVRTGRGRWHLYY